MSGNRRNRNRDDSSHSGISRNVFREIQGGEAAARKIMEEREDIAANTEEITPAMMKDTDQEKDIEGVVT